MYMKAQAGRFSKARETLKTLATTQLHPRRGMGNSHVATVHTAVEKTRDQVDTQTPGQAMWSACSSTALCEHRILWKLQEQAATIASVGKGARH